MKGSVDSTSLTLETVLKTAEEINMFDYKKMMENFELESRHEAHLRKIKQRWSIEAKNYNRKIRQMKIEREAQYKQKNHQLMEKLNKKDQILITALTAKRQAKSAEKQRMIKEIMEKENEAKKKVQDFLYEQELQRLREAQRTEEKMELFKSQQLMRRKESHEKIVDQITQKETRFSVNYQRLIEKNKQMEKQKEKQAFKKYEAFYWHRKEQEKKQKERKTKSVSKLAEKESRLEELEKDHDQKRKEIMKKLRSITMKKEEHDKKKAYDILKAKEKRNELFIKMEENKQLLKSDRDNLRLDVLDYQNAILERSLNKDSVTNLKRVNAHELVVVHQMTLNKKISKFNSKMNQIKSNSIGKIPMEKRIKMYKEMKLKETEKKRKEEEDKQIKS